MNGKRGSAWALALVVGLGFGVLQAGGPTRHGKAQKAPSTREILAAVVGWWVGGSPPKAAPCADSGSGRGCPGTSETQALDDQSRAESTLGIDPNG